MKCTNVSEHVLFSNCHRLHDLFFIRNLCFHEYAMKSLLKPFVLKAMCFGYEKALLCTTSISKVKIFLKILTENLNKLSETYFFGRKKILDLVELFILIFLYSVSDAIHTNIALLINKLHKGIQLTHPPLVRKVKNTNPTKD